MEEIWKDIPEYEGLYQVSNLGRVKSLPKEWVSGRGAIRKHNGKILKPQKEIHGYVHVSLWNNGKGKFYKIHQLVAMAFLNHKPCGMKLVIDHINDDKTDNCLDNLQIVTSRFNTCKTQGKYSSKYKGVSWDKNAKKWVAQITISRKVKNLGRFNCELKAHQAYQNALKNLESMQLISS
jgi:hypothetical protein